MRSRGALAARLCTRWVRLYTKRLPVDVAARRRDEVASDLWEHAADAEAADLSRIMVNIEVLGRVLSGMPADISWRWAMRRTSRPWRSHPEGVTMRIPQRSKALTVLAGIVMVWSTLVIVLSVLHSREVTFDQLIFGAIFGGGLLALVLGMLWRARWPGPALALITIGAIAPAGMLWLLPLYAPIGALLIFNAFISTPRVRSVQDTLPT